MFFEMSHSSTASLQMHQSRTDGRTGHCRRRVLKILVNELKKEEPKSLDSKLLKIISSNILYSGQNHEVDGLIHNGSDTGRQKDTQNQGCIDPVVVSHKCNYQSPRLV